LTVAGGAVIADARFEVEAVVEAVADADADGGGVVKPHFRLGVQSGSWVTDPYNPCGSSPVESVTLNRSQGPHLPFTNKHCPIAVCAPLIKSKKL
jgi:hypothetical protein